MVLQGIVAARCTVQDYYGATTFHGNLASHTVAPQASRPSLETVRILRVDYHMKVDVNLLATKVIQRSDLVVQRDVGTAVVVSTLRRKYTAWGALVRDILDEVHVVEDFQSASRMCWEMLDRYAHTHSCHLRCKKLAGHAVLAVLVEPLWLLSPHC